MERNIVGRVLLYTGIVFIIAGLFLGISMIVAHSARLPANMEGEIRIMDMLVGFSNSSLPYIIGGFLLIGASEIIKLLHSINRKPGLYKEVATMQQSDTGVNIQKIEDESRPTDWKLSKTDEEKIYEAFSDKAILEIIASPFEGYCIVKLQEYDGPLDPVIKVVDLNGLNLQEVKDHATKQKILDWYKE
ncbi:hypothetical protein J2Z83_002685 [Virgibacillus natechei]|uniref:Uncharacterized protein n=1 Tax=Virgibacillus natechei TaxID=1216297 RepID=A0ABS4IHX8_9BACI|nr:hypothetical protein [Virgibacillus natechei]MBP1970564.1 hypothetical protein [Virgibacillus natechei]UZD14036.1 hypothetical protein OLD84_05830 [Virgibacillus natechei]